MNYQKKYIKYKSKYILSKHKHVHLQMGGNDNEIINFLIDDDFKNYNDITADLNRIINDVNSTISQKTFARMRLNSRLPFNLDRKKAYYTELVEKYNNLPFYGNILLGGLNFNIKIDNIPPIIYDKFSKLLSEGKIKSASEFELIKDKYFILGNYFTPKKNVGFTNLTRIWCADYLEQYFKNNPQDGYDAKISYTNDYVLVLPDSFFNNNTPFTISIPLGSMSLKSLEYDLKSNDEYFGIYFNKINGENVASNLPPDILSRISATGFIDYKDNGNIMYDASNNTYYLVDIEAKSFNIPEESYNHDFARIFKYIHGITKTLILYANITMNSIKPIPTEKINIF